jgi:hypothetical protein
MGGWKDGRMEDGSMEEAWKDGGYGRNGRCGRMEGHGGMGD